LQFWRRKRSNGPILDVYDDDDDDDGHFYPYWFYYFSY
jgi:hypothetical protein